MLWSMVRVDIEKREINVRECHKKSNDIYSSDIFFINGRDKG